MSTTPNSSTQPAMQAMNPIIVGPTTVILPIDLGAATSYDKELFTLTYHGGAGDIVNKGAVLLTATLDEMIKIKEIGIDFAQKTKFLAQGQIGSVGDQRHLPSVRSHMYSLVTTQAELESYRKTMNPIKSIRNYRAARMFHAASLSLYLGPSRWIVLDGAVDSNSIMFMI